MTIPRIFVPTKLQINQKIELDPTASHHLLQVLRLQPQNQLLVFNNAGGEFKARLIAINKHQAVVILEEFITDDKESPLSIHLGQGISRGEKMDFTIQKAVELGANIITPLFTTYCNVKLDAERLGKRIHHWQGVAISATEQSGRCYVPQIMPAQNLLKWASIPVLEELRLVFAPNAKNKLSDLKEKPKKITILVGPEGGLSEEEISSAKQNNFLPVTLGPRILRTETAALAAISILQSMWGDY